MAKQKKPLDFSGVRWDWKAIAVVLAFVGSILTLFQVESDAKFAEMQKLANLSPTDLHEKVMAQAVATPDWSKLNKFEQEDLIKDLTDQGQLANNVQILGHVRKYVIFTSLKLGLDLRGGSQLVLQALPAPPAVPDITPEVMRGVETVINNRINSLGVSETIIQRSGKDRLIVELPGIKDPQQAKDRIGTTALLQFKELVPSADGTPSWKDVGLTGADFKHAQALPMGGGNVWRVNFEFKPDGAHKFGELTTRLVGKPIGIFLDGMPTDRDENGVPLTPERYHGVNVREPILAGVGEITGNFSKEQAVDLAVKLNAGALPVPIRIIEERTVGATLGQDSIQKSLVAGAVGIAMVMLFMVAIYGLPGLVADMALVLYALATLAIFKGTPATPPITLTLAGIAGFILSIGMAVDANILIFERTKEEIKSGRSLFTAIENGFSRAWPSIRDSNCNSLIACAVLMLFGTSIVKGFAVTLAIGVGVSMFTAVTATRTLLHLIPKQANLFGSQAKQSSPQYKSKEAV